MKDEFYHMNIPVNKNYRWKLYIRIFPPYQGCAWFYGKWFIELPLPFHYYFLIGFFYSNLNSPLFLIEEKES